MGSAALVDQQFTGLSAQPPTLLSACLTAHLVVGRSRDNTNLVRKFNKFSSLQKRESGILMDVHSTLLCEGLVSRQPQTLASASDEQS